MKAVFALSLSLFFFGTASLGAAPPPLDSVLAFSTYLPNGFGPTYQAWAVATDSSGAVYVTGSYAPLPYYPSSWPQTPYVMKLSPGGEVLYTTVFPGTGVSIAQAIAVDDRGQAYIAGQTNGTLPQIGGLAPSFRRGGSYEAFAAKLSPTGEILYSTVLGGSLRDTAWAVGIDGSGAIYVAGETSSRDFPQVGSAPLSRGAVEDVFITKLVPGHPEPAWSVSFGGSAVDWVNGLAVDTAGRSYLTGRTYSPDFPMVGAFQEEKAGGQDAFVVSLSPGGDEVLYSTFLGGSHEDSGEGIDVDASGRAWVGGITISQGFPVLNPLQASLAGAFSYGDGFVSGFSPQGDLIFSTYFGGPDLDYVRSLAVDQAGILHLAGATNSAQFPLKDPVQEHCGAVYSIVRYCPSDAFVARMDPRVPSLLFSTYLGGSVRSIDYIRPEDFALGIAVDRWGNDTVVGGTYSRDFPLVNPIFTRNETPVHFASFVTRFLASNQPPDCSTATVVPAVLWPPNKRLVRISISGVSDPQGDPVTLRVTRIDQDEPRTGKSPDVSGVGTAQPWVRADRDGQGDGRVYHIEFQATDASGASCTGQVTVCVPHDKGKGSCVDSGGKLP